MESRHVNDARSPGFHGRIGTEATFAPFEFTNEKNEIVGFDIDVAKCIAKEMGVELKIVNMKFDGLVGALAAKQVDLVVAGMTITAAGGHRQSAGYGAPRHAL